MRKPPRSARRPGLWRSILVIAVVAVGVVLILAFAPLFLPSRTVYGSPFPFSAFFVPANSSGSSAPDGPWTPVVALGVAVPSSEPGTSGTVGLGGENCSTVWEANSTPDLPATPSSAPPGEVAAWFLFSVDASGNALLTLATNTSGSVQATALVEVPQSCLLAIGGDPPLNGSIIDSTVAAATANAGGGQSYLASNPGATEEYLAADNSWTVAYSTCPFSGSVGSGTEFVAVVNALSDVLLVTHSLPSFACSG